MHNPTKFPEHPGHKTHVQIFLNRYCLILGNVLASLFLFILRLLWDWNLEVWFSSLFLPFYDLVVTSINYFLASLFLSYWGYFVTGIWNFDFLSLFLPFYDLVVTSNRRKPPPISKSLATSLTCPGQVSNTSSGDRQLASQRQCLRPHGRRGRLHCDSAVAVSGWRKPEHPFPDSESLASFSHAGSQIGTV